MTKQQMSICLWFDGQAEEAAKLYTSIFPNSKMGSISRYGKEGFEIHKQPAGSAMVVLFSLNDMHFMALNGGPLFRFNESVSVVVHCETQEEIDHYWSRLTEGGKESQCGWLKDKFGLSWQIVPAILGKLMTDPERSGRIMNAVMQMKKFDIKKLLDA
jgi:predicted 3-demethylubiquinone-9 3-methyltransferase (glyoxalase superfamily)